MTRYFEYGFQAYDFAGMLNEDGRRDVKVEKTDNGYLVSWS